MNITEARINGDFRSEDCTTLLKQADIVVTNPPFSLFRDFFKWLMRGKEEFGTDFLIIGNNNAVTYKEIFPYFRNKQISLGYKKWSGSNAYFIVPDDYESKSIKVVNGVRLANVMYQWFTTLPVKKNNSDFILVEKYTPEKYPKYDNYDAIEVGAAKEIPIDYYGVMGVPISYLPYFNPDQFDIVALRKNPDGTVAPWTVEREREFNDRIQHNSDPRSTEESRCIAKWQDCLCTNPNTKEMPVDICYPYISNRAEGTNNFDLDGKETYRRITIRRRANS